MDLLSLTNELQLDIYFKSLNFNGLVNLTRSIKLIMLICKSSYDLVFCRDKIYFWHQVLKMFGCSYNHIIDSKILWLHFNPKEFIKFKELDDETIALHRNGKFDNIVQNKLLYKFPSDVLNKKINNCSIINNYDTTIRLSSKENFIATHENSTIIIYKNKLKFQEYKLKLNYWELFESYKGVPVIVNRCGYINKPIQILYNNNIIELPYKAYKSFNGDLLIWDEHETYDCNGLIIYNPDTNTFNQVTCINSKCEIVTVCRQSGIIAVIQNNNLIAFTNDNKLLWQQNINDEMLQNQNISEISPNNNNKTLLYQYTEPEFYISGIGYGLLLLMNDFDCWVLDIYTGKKLLYADGILAINLHEYTATYSAIKNNGEYQIIWKSRA